MPVYFQRRAGEAPLIETFNVPEPFQVVIGDTGVRGPTAVSVGDVRKAWQADPPRYERLFDEIGSISQAARKAIEAGRPSDLGPLTDENQDLLRQAGVSSPELDRLKIQAAKSAGALGAKLSGGGHGGNMIALVEDSAVPGVAQALQAAGAVRCLVTQVKGHPPA